MRSIFLPFECCGRAKRYLVDIRLTVQEIKVQIIRISRVAALLVVFAAWTATAMAGAYLPTGKFCGRLLSTGIMTEVETSFDPDGRDGKIIGSYAFVEQGRMVSGMLMDAGEDSDRNGLTRAFIWRDKYGYGKLSVTFTPDFSEFQGQWNDGGSTSFPWNGKRCRPLNS